MVSLLQGEIDKRVNFITDHLALGESHMVDFFVQDHWNNLVGADARAQLLEMEESDLFSVKTMLQKHPFAGSEKPISNYIIGDLARYFASAGECAIEHSQFCHDVNIIEERLGQNSNVATGNCEDIAHLVSTKEYMCSKKSHEVEEMSYLVNSMCRGLGVSHVLDMGSGKGYLGTHLSLRYGLDVIGVDCSETNSSSALLRSQKFLKYWNAHLKNKTDIQLQKCDLKYQPVTVHVDSESDINLIFVNNHGSEGEPKIQEEVMLTGLHACGDLSSTALRTFVSKTEVKAMCVVGCCYHLITSDKVDGIENGFPMSDYLAAKNFTLQRNTRMLGLKSLDRIQGTDMKTIEEKSTRSLFYRAVLSVILHNEFGMESSSKQFRVGKEYSKSKDFMDYVRRSLKRLQVPEDKATLISDEKISSYLVSMEPLRKTLLGFNMLREAFGPAVEALILLDKLLYLREQAHPNQEIDSYLIRLFDPVKSPRCYALVAMKK